MHILIPHTEHDTHSHMHIHILTSSRTRWLWFVGMLIFHFVLLSTVGLWGLAQPLYKWKHQDTEAVTGLIKMYLHGGRVPSPSLFCTSSDFSRLLSARYSMMSWEAADCSGMQATLYP